LTGLGELRLRDDRKVSSTGPALAAGDLPGADSWFCWLIALAMSEVVCRTDAMGEDSSDPHRLVRHAMICRLAAPLTR